MNTDYLEIVSQMQLRIEQQHKEIEALKQALRDFVTMYKILKNNGLDIRDYDQKMDSDYIDKIENLLK